MLFHHLLHTALPRYNIQALQDRLEMIQGTSSLPGGAPPTALSSALVTALTTTNQHHLAALSQNPVALFEEYKKCSDQTVSHVRRLKDTTSTLNLLRQRFPNPQVTPRAVQEQIFALDRQQKVAYGILGEKVKRVNWLMIACRSTPLSADAVYMGILNRQRVTLYNELEQLRQLPSLTAAAAVAAGGAPPTSSITIQQNPGGVAASNIPPPQVSGPERTAVNSRPHNQPTPPLGGNPFNQVTRQGPPPSSNAAVNRNSPINEVSSTTNDPAPHPHS